jgi:hypothetical protein
MLNQMVYDVIQGHYGKPSQTSLADSLSQSLSTSMVEHARLFNLLVEYVNQDQPQASDSILPLSRLPMDLREEERANEDVTLARPLNSLLVESSRKPRG